MKYVANPVVVDAFVITGFEENPEMACTDAMFEDAPTVHLTPEMMARYTPILGDYYVIQDDGYAYVNPKNVFERKYSKVKVGVAE